VQYSLIDQRPSRELTSLCQERNVTLLCYGTLLGGFLTDRYLGMHEPNPSTFQSTSEEKVTSTSVDAVAKCIGLSHLSAWGSRAGGEHGPIRDVTEL
jgi:aryl-alcohol dehydrogenase-like predicted oxidoreductase